MYKESIISSAARKRSNFLVGGIIGILLILGTHNQVALSRPVTTDELEGTTSSVLSEQNETPTDQVQTNKELENTSAQASNNSGVNPQDYVSDDMPLDELLKAIELACSGRSNTEPRDDAKKESSLDLGGTTTSTPLPFVETDEEFDEIMNRLSADAADSVSHPLNYITNDEDVDRIAKLIADGEVDKLHERWLNNRDLFAEEEECPICRDEFGGQVEEYKLPCGHLFHKECLKDWLSRSDTCPMCRQQVSGFPGQTQAPSQHQTEAGTIHVANNVEITADGQNRIHVVSNGQGGSSVVVAHGGNTGSGSVSIHIRNGNEEWTYNA